MSSIQYISDIHLEFYNEKHETFNIIPHSPNLALCGDIGYPNDKIYRKFIIKCSQLFKNVFVIFGNHEFYNIKMDKKTEIQTMNYKKSLMNNFPQNVYFLDNKFVYLDTFTNEIYDSSTFINFDSYLKPRFIKILGSTLWSDIDYYTATKMNDTRCIYINENRLLDHNDIKSMYNNNINWIISEISKEPKIQCILLTHHAVHPVFLNNEEEYNPRIHVKSAYINWIPELYENNNLIACICGHTHNSVYSKIYFKNNNYIYFLSNPVGYKHEKNVLQNDPNDKYNCLFKFTLI